VSLFLAIEIPPEPKYPVDYRYDMADAIEIAWNAKNGLIC